MPHFKCARSSCSSCTGRFAVRSRAVSSGDALAQTTQLAAAVTAGLPAHLVRCLAFHALQDASVDELLALPTLLQLAQAAVGVDRGERNVLGAAGANRHGEAVRFRQASTPQRAPQGACRTAKEARLCTWEFQGAQVLWNRRTGNHRADPKAWLAPGRAALRRSAHRRRARTGGIMTCSWGGRPRRHRARITNGTRGIRGQIAPDLACGLRWSTLHS